MRKFALLTILALALFGAVSAQPAAAAETPCWKQLLNDWFDGRIDGSYPVRCYREALDHLPEDVEKYSDAREQIERALATALDRSGGTLGENDLVPPEPATDGEDGSGAGGPGGAGPGGGSGEGGGIVDEAFKKTGPNSADGIPLPLLVLGGIGVLLLLAAVAGYIARRVQGRRVPIAADSPRS